MSEKIVKRLCPICKKELKEGNYPSLWNAPENRVVLVWCRECDLKRPNEVKKLTDKFLQAL